MIYGVALLAGCMLVGSFFGNLLGLLRGLNSDIVGLVAVVLGVGVVLIMLLLIPVFNKIAAKTAKTAKTATFYTGLGCCLLCPSVLYLLVKTFLP